MNFDKPFLTVDQQLDLLAQRGLLIKDHERAKSYLSNISYYRLSAYSKYFQEKNSQEHKFREGSDFDSILNLYLFDRELRIFVFDVIEKLEIAFRTQLTYCYSVKHGGWWYEDPQYFTNNFYYSKNLNKIDEEIGRSGEFFIEHYKTKYASPQRPPAWMTFEVISMGSLSKIYKNLKMSPAKKEIARHFKMPSPYVLESWMQSINYVRNICAHHSRLWNRILTIRPELPHKTENTWLINKDVNSAKMYVFLSCLVYLIKVINNKTRFGQHFRELVARYPSANLSSMGFHEKWETEELWK